MEPTNDEKFAELFNAQQDRLNQMAAPPPTSDVFTHSLSIAKLATALAAAQLKYEPLVARQVADAEKYKYTYADLAAVLAAIQPALATQGIAIVQGVSMQRPQGSSGLIVLVETRLLHASGEWIATTLKLPSGEVAPQKVGSLVSYLRRYGLLAMAGVAAEDDDGKQAQDAAPPKRTAPKPEPTREPATSKPAAQKPKPVNATPEPERVAPRVIADPVRPVEGTPITAKDRGLLFKVAKEQGLNETQVKQLIFALWGFTSTGQIQQGAQFGKLLSAMENPQDHGVTIGNGDLTYDRAADPNALGNDDLGGL
jgi:hypothetical protein